MYIFTTNNPPYVDRSKQTDYNSILHDISYQSTVKAVDLPFESLSLIGVTLVQTRTQSCDLSDRSLLKSHNTMVLNKLTLFGAGHIWPTYFWAQTTQKWLNLLFWNSLTSLKERFWAFFYFKILFWDPSLTDFLLVFGYRNTLGAGVGSHLTRPT